MGDYVKSKLKQIKELIGKTDFDEDVELILDRIYEDGFQDGQNEINEQQETKKLLSRKPVDLVDVYTQTTRSITPAELSEMIKVEKEFGKKNFEDWNEFTKFNFSKHRFWKVLLQKENELILVDTQGYDYPRYIGRLEKHDEYDFSKDKLDRIKWIDELNERAKQLEDGKQFEPAGGQCETDATDFRYIAQLIKEKRDNKAIRMIQDLDTASRDAIPDDILDWAGYEKI